MHADRADTAVEEKRTLVAVFIFTVSTPTSPTRSPSSSSFFPDRPIESESERVRGGVQRKRDPADENRLVFVFSLPGGPPCAG